jgi:hypothetical protein
MYNLELPTKILLEIADIVGLDAAFKERAKSISMLNEIERMVRPDAASQSLTPEEEAEVKNFRARAARLKRTLNGLRQVMKPYLTPERGFEDIGLDRTRQAYEEFHRLRINWQALIADLDSTLLNAARNIIVGQRSLK